MKKKFTKGEIARYEFHYPLILEELKTDRHLSPILSGYGFIYQSERERMNEYLKSVEKKELLEIK